MSTPFRPAEFYAPAGARLDAYLGALARTILAVSEDLEAIRDLLLPMLDAPTRERLRNAEPGQWRAALSGLAACTGLGDCPVHPGGVSLAGNIRSIDGRCVHCGVDMRECECIEPDDDDD